MNFKTLLAAALTTSLFAGEKPIENYNIPLWAEGKVPLALADGPLDKPFLMVFQAPEGKRDGCVGFAGFSAGSSLALAIPAASAPGDPTAADPIDKQSSKPDYLVLVYGPGRPGKGEELKSFPPVFLLSAAYDRGAANGSAQLFLDLNKAGAVAELHIYQKGRHGFGAAYASPEFSPWMDALKHFLVQGAFIKGGR